MAKYRVYTYLMSPSSRVVIDEIENGISHKSNITKIKRRGGALYSRKLNLDVLFNIITTQSTLSLLGNPKSYKPFQLKNMIVVSKHHWPIK